jgi:hypothetical protein
MVTVWEANVAQRRVNGIMNDKQDQNIYSRLKRFGLTMNVSQMLGGMNGYNN